MLDSVITNTDHPSQSKGILLNVLGIKSSEVAYNPAVIVQRNKNKIAQGVNIIAARVESLDSHWLDPKKYDPHIMFFTSQNNNLVPIPNAPIFLQAEDPCATWLIGENGEPQLLFGLVKVDRSSEDPIITTQFYLAPDIFQLDVNKPLVEVKGMKDIRVVQLQNGKIALFTRPTTDKAFPGRVGFALIDSVEQIETASITAQLLKFQINKDAKIGVNEAFEKGESIHVFCHVATCDPIDQDGDKVFDFESSPIHYVGYEFDINPNHPFDTPIALHKVVDRSNFPVNKIFSKGHRFDDVIFPGGTGGLDEAQYFCGVEDARIGVINILNS